MCRIDRNGLVARAGNLLEGDYITAIDGMESSEMLLIDAQFHIRDVNDFLILRLRRYGHFRKVEKTVRLHRNSPHMEFGFKIHWGCDRPRFPDDDSFYVHHVMPNSSASEFVEIGDIIRSVNEVSVDGMPHKQLKNKIRPFQGLEIVLGLERTEFRSPMLWFKCFVLEKSIISNREQLIELHNELSAEYVYKHLA